MKNNQRRNQYRHFRNEINQKKKGFLEFLKESVALISAGAGIFSVLLYLSGRSFASGYFSAMNIPSYHVSFSIWEYGEVAWLPMLIYPSFIFGSSALLGFILSIVWEWLTTHVPFLSKWGNTEKTVQKAKLKNSQIWLLIFLLSALLLLIIPLVSSTLYFVNRWGELEGTLNVTRNAAQIEIVSDDPFYLNNETNDGELKIYQGYYLLTINNGKYFLYRDIDPQTCKPLAVTVIDASGLRQVTLKEPDSSSNKCSKELPTGLWQIITYIISK